MKMKTMAPKKAPMMKLTPSMASRIRAKASKVLSQPGAGVRPDKDSAAGAAT